MALPPILSNIPFLKIFKSDQAGRVDHGPQANAAKPADTGDTVQISSEAQKKLSTDQAYATATHTRNELAQTGMTLGLDPGFKE